MCVKKEKYINSLVQCAAGPLQSFTNLFMMVVGLSTSRDQDSVTPSSRVGLSPVQRPRLCDSLQQGGVESRSRDQGGVESRSRDQGEVESRPRDQGGVESRPRDQGGVESRPRDQGGVESRSRDQGGVESRPHQGGVLVGC